MNPILKHALITAGVLAVFTVVGTALLSGTFEKTREPIAQSEKEAKRNLLSQVVPPAMHDNDLLQDTVQLPPSELLGQAAASTAYRAWLNGKPSAVILEAIAPDGYSGEIKLLVGIGAEGALTGVRVLTHKETPGLGDYIDIAHSDWIKNFDGKSLAKEGGENSRPGALPDEAWKVKKDGGKFDYMTGATISPRAVVKAVHKALVFFNQSRDTIFPDGDQQASSEETKEQR
ncbi:MAG TPA: electron transport complex subunit RsxG [Methylophilaceae bacterium]|nr:electron transport complex subunit RsxG [Methylophilaceae bacterium]